MNVRPFSLATYYLCLFIWIANIGHFWTTFEEPFDGTYALTLVFIFFFPPHV